MTPSSPTESWPLDLPVYVLTETVRDERSHSPCSLMMEATSGRRYALLFTKQDAAEHYLKRTGITARVRTILGMDELASVAKQLMLQQRDVREFILDPRGDAGRHAFLNVRDAARLRNSS